MNQPVVDLEGLEGAAAELARRIGPGDRIFLTGDLGSGKTTFVRAMLRELGVRGTIPSPSFTVITSYPCRDFVFSHVDLYRLGATVEELEQFGVLDLLESDGVVAVEWAERLPEALRAGGWTIRIGFLEGGVRELGIEHGRLAGDRD